MNTEHALAYCQTKPEATLEYPFGPQVAVFKIKGKVFALIPVSAAEKEPIARAIDNKPTAKVNEQYKASISLKCDPDRAQALRDIYPAIIGGYHLNKKHWNTILLNNSVPTSEIESQIDHSYQLVIRGLRKQDRDSLHLRHGAFPNDDTHLNDLS